MPQMQPSVVPFAQNPSNVLKQLKVDDGGALVVTSEGGGNAVTVADGADVAEGHVADAAWSGSGNGTVIAILKALYAEMVAQIGDLAGSFTHISANGTSAAIKTGAGVLVSATVNTAGAAANVLTLYDSLTGTGTVIAVIDATAIGQRLSNLKFTTGLSAVLATGTAADITLVWR